MFHKSFHPGLQRRLQRRELGFVGDKNRARRLRENSADSLPGTKNRSPRVRGTRESTSKASRIKPRPTGF